MLKEEHGGILRTAWGCSSHLTHNVVDGSCKSTGEQHETVIVTLLKVLLTVVVVCTSAPQCMHVRSVQNQLMPSIPKKRGCGKEKHISQTTTQTPILTREKKSKSKDLNCTFEKLF